MPLVAPRNDPERPASAKPIVAPRLRWSRLLLLVALSNTPMFFQGCESQKFQFTLGPVLPFTQFEADDQQPLLPTALIYWSWPKFVANFSIVVSAVWLASRVAWIRRVFASVWFAVVLFLVAIVFNLWLIWPQVWEHAVLSPQGQLYALILRAAGQPNTPSPTLVWWAMVLSGRLYYVLFVAGLALSVVLSRLFLRRYFFVRTGSRWQVQLGGLVIVMLILGAGIGMAIRVLVQQ